MPCFRVVALSSREAFYLDFRSLASFPVLSTGPATVVLQLPLGIVTIVDLHEVCQWSGKIKSWKGRLEFVFFLSHFVDRCLGE